jgi:hypothetical protein
VYEEFLQARVAAIRFIHDWRHPRTELHEQYEYLQRAFPEDVIALMMDDPQAAWALPRRDARSERATLVQRRSGSVVASAGLSS